MTGWYHRLALRYKVLVHVLVTVLAFGLLNYIALYLIMSAHGVGHPQWEGMFVSIQTTYLVILVLLAGAMVPVTFMLTDRLTRPLLKLIRTADEISTGNLNVGFSFGRRTDCWKDRNCDRRDCPAWESAQVRCWYVDGTPCEGIDPSFPQKLEQCRRCDVYLNNRGDEIVQLADAFQHMTKNLRDYQEELLKGERLAATGEAVASISHSIKNIVDGLRGGIYIRRRGGRLRDVAMQSQGMEMVDRNLDSISEMVMNLLDFSRDREPLLETCDPCALVTEVGELFRDKAAARNVELETCCDRRIGELQLDRHALLHCMANLVTNAIDAIDADRPGRVVISAARKGYRLVFSVEDNGTGMTPEVRSRLFIGMFTTKGSKGTGLGLLSVQKTVRENGGTVEIDTEPGRGSIFRIVLPVFSRSDRRARWNV